MLQDIYGGPIPKMTIKPPGEMFFAFMLPHMVNFHAEGKDMWSDTELKARSGADRVTLKVGLAWGYANGKLKRRIRFTKDGSVELWMLI